MKQSVRAQDVTRTLSASWPYVRQIEKAEWRARREKNTETDGLQIVCHLPSIRRKDSTGVHFENRKKKNSHLLIQTELILRSKGALHVAGLTVCHPKYLARAPKVGVMQFPTLDTSASRQFVLRLTEIAISLGLTTSSSPSPNC